MVKSFLHSPVALQPVASFAITAGIPLHSAVDRLTDAFSHGGHTGPVIEQDADGVVMPTVPPS